VKIKTLDQLQEPDTTTLGFTPAGLGRMAPDDAAEYQQSVIAEIELAGSVAAGTRAAFERLRTTFAYGVLCYEIYTLVYDQALLIAEQALRDRFLDHHRPTITFADKHGDHKTVTVDEDGSYGRVIAFLKANRSYCFLDLADGQPALRFGQGMLSDLTQWARRLGLLCGQRNRRHEPLHAKLRNNVAHPSAHLASPVEAAAEVLALAEVINQLWGRRTVGGKYYPAPRRRELIALGWGEAQAMQFADPRQLRSTDEVHDDWQYVIIRAVADDPDLRFFHSRFETTAYPAQLLWGPGTAAAATEWAEASEAGGPLGDAVDHLDRVFAIRLAGDDLYQPMSPEAALGVLPDERAGEWFIVRADYPSEARSHIRSRLTDPKHCQAPGPCSECAADLLAIGPYDEVTAVLAEHSAGAIATTTAVATPYSPPPARKIR
jgi:hypothetical protein